MKYRLNELEEIVGTFKGIKQDETGLTISFDGFNIEFPLGSQEAQTLQKKLNSNLIGKRIALLKTNIPGKIILLRMITKNGG